MEIEHWNSQMVIYTLLWNLLLQVCVKRGFPGCYLWHVISILSSCCRRCFYQLPDSTQPAWLVFLVVELDLSQIKTCWLPGGATFFSKALNHTVKHSKRNCLGGVDVRFLPVQSGGGLAETHVCSLVTLLCFLVRVQTLVTGSLSSSSSLLSSLSSSVLSPHNGGFSVVIRLSS